MAPPKPGAASASTTFAQYTPPTGEHMKPSTQVIEIDAAPLAQTFRHLHALLVAGLFAARFGALVSAPVPTLLAGLAPLAAAQAAYCVICLPPVDTGSAPPATKSGTPAKRKAKSKDLSVTRRVTTALLALTLSIFPSAPLLFVISVLMGAPLTTHLEHTALMAAHTALLALPPLFYTRGVDARAWREVVAALLPFDETWGGALGAVVGAWLGAVPIPLDWDREWQQWPITVVAGAYAGWAVGRYAGEYLMKGWRVRMDVE